MVKSMENEMLKWMLTILLALLFVLAVTLLYAGVYRMARVYNWNGRRDCYLGCVPVRRENGKLVVRIGEHMVDLSRTTDYRIRVSRAFGRKNRYRELLVYADGSRNYLVVDEPVMRFLVVFSGKGML